MRTESRVRMSGLTEHISNPVSLYICHSGTLPQSGCRRIRITFGYAGKPHLLTSPPAAQGRMQLKPVAVPVGGEIEVIEKAYAVFTAHRTVRGTQGGKTFIYRFEVFRRISKMLTLKTLWFVCRAVHYGLLETQLLTTGQGASSRRQRRLPTE